MRLDNEDIFVGDKVYDLGFGPGEVVEAGRTIRVRFSALDDTWTYTSEGMRRSAKRRQLYFHNPILFVPAKNSNHFTVVSKVAVAASKSLEDTSWLVV